MRFRADPKEVLVSLKQTLPRLSEVANKLSICGFHRTPVNSQSFCSVICALGRLVSTLLSRKIILPSSLFERLFRITSFNFNRCRPVSYLAVMVNSLCHGWHVRSRIVLLLSSNTSMGEAGNSETLPRVARSYLYSLLPVVPLKGSVLMSGYGCGESSPAYQ